MVYEIEILETLAKVISVDAECEEDAKNAVLNKYIDGEIALSQKDLIEKNIVTLTKWDSDKFQGKLDIDLKKKDEVE